MAYVVHQSMPFLSKDEIECRTEKLLAEFQTLEEAPIGFPIPVERIAEGLLNLRMDWDAIDETDVLARLDPSTRTVTMNTARIDFFDEYPGAQNFTVAHEIGHWKLHIYATNAVQLAMFTTKVQPFLCRSDARNRYEIQANLFAASLLMPRALIVQEYRSLDVVSWPNLYKLAELCKVSKSALKNRLCDLNLIRVTEDNDVIPLVAGQGRLWENGEAETI